ncbi:MAG: hypothetical protein OXQ93_07175 [Gemmatimonadota bacterium]|nr:hypothetical protein [Gemmatimonadota bacterium]
MGQRPERADAGPPEHLARIDGSGLGVTVRVAPHADPSAAHECRRIAIDWLQDRMDTPLPRRAMAHRSFTHAGADAVCRAIRTRDGRGDYWAAQLERTPHKNQATVTEVAVAHPEGRSPHVSISVFDRSVVPADPAGQYPAEMLAGMADRIPLLLGGRTLSHTPIVVDSPETMAGFHRMLVDPGRRMPFAVVSVPPDIEDPVLLREQWERLARMLTGLAIVWVLPPKMTYRLSDQVSKSLSVFLGAWRFYRPGFNHLADRTHHLLFLKNRMEDERGVEETARQFLAMAIEERMRAGSDAHPSVGYDDLAREEAAAGRAPARLVARLRDSLRSTSAEAPRAGDARYGQSGDTQASVHEPAPATSETVAAIGERAATDGHGPRIAAEGAEIREHRYKEVLRRADRAERERDEARQRVARLTELVRALGGDPDAATPFPTAWEQFAPWCDENLGECVSLAGAVRRDLRGAEFEDVALAARCIHWLAHEYREECLRGGNPHVHGCIHEIDESVYNLPCDEDCVDCKWRGRRHRVEWHLQCGADRHDPRRCLCIYYFWDADTQRVVVASMPSHQETTLN